MWLLASLLFLVVPFYSAEAKDTAAIETCFSPDEPCDEQLIKFVMSAEKSIDVAIYDINLDQLVHQLLLKSKKMPVRIVVDRRQSKGNHSLVSTLIMSSMLLGRSSIKILCITFLPIFNENLFLISCLKMSNVGDIRTSS